MINDLFENEKDYNIDSFTDLTVDLQDFIYGIK